MLDGGVWRGCLIKRPGIKVPKVGTLGGGEEDGIKRSAIKGSMRVRL